MLQTVWPSSRAPILAHRAALSRNKANLAASLVFSVRPPSVECQPQLPPYLPNKILLLMVLHPLLLLR